MLSRMVGPAGSVIGVDQAASALELAALRAEDAGATNVRFVEADVTTWGDDSPFDAVVGRLVLFHVGDPMAVLIHHAAGLRPGDLVVAIDFDAGGYRPEPPVLLVNRAVTWVVEAFKHAGADPLVGARLARLLGAAGLDDVTSFRVQNYIAPGNPVGPELLAGVVRSLAPVILANGIATPDELDLDTMDQRIADALRAEDAVLLPTDRRRGVGAARLDDRAGLFRIPARLAAVGGGLVWGWWRCGCEPSPRRPQSRPLLGPV